MGKFAAISRRKKINDFSFGLVMRLTDLSLLFLFLALTMTMASKHSSKYLNGLFKKLQASLDEGKIRNSFYQLKRRGLIDYSRGIWQTAEITRIGKRRLKQILPEYEPKRMWDKRLYLVSYDIPDEQKIIRDNLRRILIKLGCGQLQKSVWLTPYNPKKALKDFVAENDLEGLVLVSDLGKDGSIGEEDNRNLVNRVYSLDELNKRYSEFLTCWKDKQIQPEITAHFFSILRDDPQLPFELLPDDWLGEQAWEFVSKQRHSIS